MRNQRLSQFESIRGLAAFLVLIHHVIVLSPRPFSPDIMFMLSVTPIGPMLTGQPFVMIFFVLSGLVLALALEASWRPLLFMIKRVIRLLLPLLVAVLVASLLVYTTGGRGSGGGYADWFTFIDFNQPDLVTVAMVLRHLSMSGMISDEGFNTVIWSLALELRMSLLMPLIYLSVCRSPRVTLLAAAIIGIAAELALHGQLPGYDRRMVIGDGLFLINDATGTFLATLAVLPAFVFGAVVGCHRRQIASMVDAMPRWGVILLAALVAIGLGLPSVVVTAIAAAFLLALSLRAGSAQTFLIRPSFQYLGRISYSLYLTHFPILIAAINLLGDHIHPVWVFSIGIAVALGVAHVFHLLIEAPSIRLARRLR